MLKINQLWPHQMGYINHMEASVSYVFVSKVSSRLNMGLYLAFCCGHDLLL